MAYYSSKCVDCTERTKKVLRKAKYRDEKGNYYIPYYQCNNVACNVAIVAGHKKCRTIRKNKGKQYKGHTSL